MPDVELINESGQSLQLRHIISERVDSPTLVFRTSALGCDICLQEEMKHISNYVSEIKNVVILASDYNVRELKILKSTIEFDFEIYQSSQTGIPFDKEYNNLFTFIIDNTFIVKDFFVPEKTLPELSQGYYKAISSKYW